MEEQIKMTIEQLRPMLQSDGGDIEFVALEGNTVKVRLQGACHGCPHAAMTIKQGVETRIREVFPQIEQVLAVN